MAKHPRRYVEAGEFFKDLRCNAGHVSRDAFARACWEIGVHLTVSQIYRLEQGRKEPTITHFLAYQRIVNCDMALVGKVPGLVPEAA